MKENFIHISLHDARKYVRAQKRKEKIIKLYGTKDRKTN